MNETDRIREAAAGVRARTAPDAQLGLVLGSGLKDFAQSLDEPVEIPFADVPHWPVPRVEGHGGSLVFGMVAGVRVACLTGRVHLYEGWEPAEVVRAVRTLRSLGVSAFLLTNAAGGANPDWSPGDLMVIADHLNMTGMTPLLGAAEEALGPRFPDQSQVWDPALRRRMHALDGGLREGVYVGNLGPSYETPAEVRMARALGGDAVGMSTVHEAIALNAMGARLVGISLISNLAAGLSPQPLSHDEVMEAGRLAGARMSDLVTRFCRELGA